MNNETSTTDHDDTRTQTEIKDDKKKNSGAGKKAQRNDDKKKSSGAGKKAQRKDDKRKK